MCDIEFIVAYLLLSLILLIVYYYYYGMENNNNNCFVNIHFRVKSESVLLCSENSV